MDDLGKAITKRLGQLQSNRSTSEQVWRDCFTYSFPSRVDGFSGQTKDAAQTQSDLNRLFDSTLAESSNILVSSIQSGMTPSNAVWPGFDTANATEEESKWFDAAANVIWANIHASNFDSEDFEATIDMLAGYGVIFIDTDRQKGGYVFEWWPMSGCFLAQSKKGGPIDTIYRPYKLTADQAVNQFNLKGDKLSDALLKTAKEKPDELVEFVHAIYPRKNGNGVMPKNLPYASVHVECKSNKTIRESGYHEQPFSAFRWAALPNSPYGIGPMSIALPDVRTINEVKRMELMNLDMAASGMYKIRDDGVLNPKTIKIGPRKCIVMNDMESMQPIAPAGNFQVTFVSEDRLEAKIKRVMMADHLTPRDGPVETAAAVYERIALLRQLLGPLYGRMQSEKLKVLVERCFGLAYRAGILPPMPDSLRGKTAQVSYRSPFARAQKMEEVAAIERAWTTAGLISQAKGGDQEVFDHLDDTESIRDIVKALGSENILRSPEAVKALREQRVAVQEQAAQAAMAAPAIEAVGQGAGKALGEQMVAA